MTKEKQKIVYTLTDEAPLLATCSLLPVIRTFAQAADIDIELSDISLSARILAAFPENLSDEQKVPDYLEELGRMTQDPDANIIKLPNISASVPQLTAAIAELQALELDIPDFPEIPVNETDESIKERYSKVLGSAVNPVLREGNSDRRAPTAVKNYVRKNPHKMAKWSPASRTHVSHMRDGDFYHSEKCMLMERDTTVKMDLVTDAGDLIVLKEKTELLKDEIIDSMYMSKKALCRFLEEQMEDARQTHVMFSLHVKATMMKVSHPIVFGHAIKVFYKDVFVKHGELFGKIGVNPNNGISSVYEKIKTLPKSLQEEIEEDIHACYEFRPEVAMVDSTKGISNLHAPNDVIVDASMPAMIRAGGKMYGPDGRLKDVKAVMPESTFARIYQEMISFCKDHGAFDPTTMGTVPNVGLMAQKAEEYGSHDKTFEIPADGRARIVDHQGHVLLEQRVEKGDIWRMCQTKDEPVKDWVKLAITRARQSDTPAVFWLDEYRPHEAMLIKRVKKYLQEHDLSGLNIQIMSQLRGMRYSLERILRGKDTISVTGNILRDYLTDLFPIMELGTSAKMLSIVPLMAGGSLFETGAGGSAPRHIEQILQENHLRWDSLGEFLAIAASLDTLGIKHHNAKARVLSRTLDQAIETLLENNKSPSRKTGELDNRGSHFYLAMYWAQALVDQTDESELQEAFAPLAKALSDNEKKIVSEFQALQGSPVDIGGYYIHNPDMAYAAMRPSETFNATLAAAQAK